MAWPKKGTRKITIDGINYRWHYSAHCPLCSDDVFTIGFECNPYVLFIDPFPYHFELKPSSVANAVRWATDSRWTPQKGPTKAMSMDRNGHYIWLPERTRHAQFNNHYKFQD